RVLRVARLAGRGVRPRRDADRRRRDPDALIAAAWAGGRRITSRLAPLELSAQPLLLLTKLRRELLAEILRLVDRSDLEHAFLAGHRVRALLRPFERLFHRLHLPQPEPGDELLRLRERPVDDGRLPAGELHALTFAARLQALPRQHDAGLDELLVVLAHRRK